MLGMTLPKIAVCGAVAGGLLLAANGVRTSWTPDLDDLTPEQNAHLRSCSMLGDTVARLKPYRYINPGAYVSVLQRAAEIAEISHGGSSKTRVKVVRSIDTSFRDLKRKLKDIHGSILLFSTTKQEIVGEYEEVAYDIITACESIIDEQYRALWE